MATTQRMLAPLVGQPAPTGPVILTSESDAPSVGVVSTTTRGPIDAASVTTLMATLRSAAMLAIPQPPTPQPLTP